MKAMILAAGLGTRLRPLSHKIPKPMIPVLGIPMIRHTLNLLKSAGITEVIINLHHLPNDLKVYLKNQKDFKISFSMEKKLLGTGGGILKAKPFFGNERFLVLNSDFLINLDLRKVISFHLEKKSLATMVIKISSHSEKYDLIALNKECCIAQFRTPDVIPPYRGGIFTGIHLFEPEIFDFFPKEKKTFCIVRDVYMNLPKIEMIKEGDISRSAPLVSMLRSKRAKGRYHPPYQFPMFGYPFKGEWHDLGSLDLYLNFHLKKLKGKKRDQFKKTLLKLCPGLTFPKITG